MRNAVDHLSISDLERLLSRRMRQVKKLQRVRERLQKKIDAVDEQIAALGGSPNGHTGRRPRNTISLDAAIHQVLEKAGKPMGVGDIAAQVERLGYRSNSANFRGIVNQTLIKDKRFGAVERGVYGIKKK